MIINLVTRIEFWSATLGLLGTVLLFLFGLPPKVDPEGHINIICAQVDEEEIKKGKMYKKLGHFGMFLLILSFVFQIIAILSYG